MPHLNERYKDPTPTQKVSIQPKDIERIFEPKFTTKSSGMGLGLGIIRNIIENYKGTITFESEFGKGTTFTVALPIINT